MSSNYKTATHIVRVSLPSAPSFYQNDFYCIWFLNNHKLKNYCLFRRYFPRGCRKSANNQHQKQCLLLTSASVVHEEVQG